jgi:hypothetical protein
MPAFNTVQKANHTSAATEQRQGNRSKVNVQNNDESTRIAT